MSRQDPGTWTNQLSVSVIELGRTHGRWTRERMQLSAHASYELI